MVSSLACVGLLGYVCEGEPFQWILSQVFSRDFQLLFAAYLLSSLIYVQITGFFNNDLQSCLFTIAITKRSALVVVYIAITFNTMEL